MDNNKTRRKSDNKTVKFANETKLLTPKYFERHQNYVIVDNSQNKATPFSRPGDFSTQRQ